MIGPPAHPSLLAAYRARRRAAGWLLVWYSTVQGEPSQPRDNSCTGGRKGKIAEVRPLFVCLTEVGALLSGFDTRFKKSDFQQRTPPLNSPRCDFLALGS